ncbi:DNA polymerase III subunit alpha [Flavobacteriaceae bacterium]|nr:DNA polymerase III subunit alpha [Flavobacteriaceae bacterium]
MFLIFDTETTGLPKKWSAPLTDFDNWPRAIQVAWQVHDISGNCISNQSYVVHPDGFSIPYDSEKIHGISTQLAKKIGVDISFVLNKFQEDLKKSQFMCGHNLNFDEKILGAEYLRSDGNNPLQDFPKIDTCTEETAGICMLKGGRGRKFKLPTLMELYTHLFNKKFESAHNASADVEATALCLFKLLKDQKIHPNSLSTHIDIIEKLTDLDLNKIKVIDIVHINLFEESKLLKENVKPDTIEESNPIKEASQEFKFGHLHSYTQFSILQSTSKISDLLKYSIEHSHDAIAITDKSNLMGAFHFIKTLKNYNENLQEGQKYIKPIIGCELNVCENHLDKSNRDDGYQMIFLAKNKNGFRNISKLSSIANIDGFYYLPRIDKNILSKYAEDVIVLSGGLRGEISSKILNQGEEKAEESLSWWKDTYGSDFYLEIQRHQQENEDYVLPIIKEFSSKYGIKLIATNNSFYTTKSEANAHDILLCVRDGEKQAVPIGRGRGFRYGLPNEEYWYKSKDEMFKLFSDIPDSIYNISDIIDKVEPFDLAREVLLPDFTVPEKFIQKNDFNSQKGQNLYLRHLTLEGIKKKYKNLDKALQERIDFELDVISKTGYPGYFLIVQDFINAAREMEVSVGPGRGSAAGSVVAYALGITSIDPIKYNLLFERFLNPDRVSLPDIDIDFDDEGRNKVIEYVVDKYGSQQVAQIITYGRMAAKSSIRDTGRVLDLSLSEVDRISKLVPNMKLGEIFSKKDADLKLELRTDEFSRVSELKKLYNSSDLSAQTLKQASMLEGSLRNTGIHACGVIITPSDISEFVPITKAKDSDFYVTQFDNSVVEDAGLLKMDFLGLKTLTIIKDTVKLIKYKYDIQLNPEEFPLNNDKTYQLFQKGETVGIFQYESLGMQKYLKELKPSDFNDLIAMNALYRPGPLEYIPSFISRKNGSEPIAYDLPEMEEFLKETYGITVYQEQVMLLSQKIADFSKGEADLLRKAMGKKIFSLIEKLKPKFMTGGQENGFSVEILEKIWKDWEAFASYAFNKSHSTCYAFIGYQTAYLKANYPSEYMAAVLSNNMNDIKQVSFFMEECKRMGIRVLGPDINESFYKFNVNEDKAIRFGMGAIKGVGKGAVETIVENRKDGDYKDIYDFAKRIDLRLANKKTFENLVLAGGFDSFKNKRAQYFNIDNDGLTFLEKTVKYGAKYQESVNSSQISLFGEGVINDTSDLTMPDCEEWINLERLKKEREVVGIYISAHPLDDYLKEINNFTSTGLSSLSDLNRIVNKDFYVGGIINEVEHLVSKTGNGFGVFSFEDFNDQYKFRIFGEDYLKYKHLIEENKILRLRIAVKEGWVNRETGRVGDPRIQFLNMELLDGIIDSSSKKITFKIDSSNFNENELKKLKNTLSKHKGSKPVYFDIYDSKNKYKLNMISEQAKVSITKELLVSLEQDEFRYKLN